MKLNMGQMDRSVRLFVLAPVLAVLGFVVGPTGLLAFVLYGLALVMVATSAVGTCPLYLPFGIRTNGHSNRTGSTPSTVR